MNIDKCFLLPTYSKGFTIYEDNRIFEYNLKKKNKLKNNEQYRKWLQNNMKTINKINTKKFRNELINKCNCN